MPELDTPVTEEARNRRQMYKVEEKRESAFHQADSSFLDFLRSCEITLTISSLAEENLVRVFELSQRTNQLNYAGRATTRKDVEYLLHGAAPGKDGVVLSCADKFGDYGIIGFAIVDVERFHVENFFMSCRVQHKKVDHAFFAWLIGRAMARGQDVVSTVFHFSGRNQSARQVLDEMKFAPMGEDEAFVSRGFAGARHRDGDRPHARRDRRPAPCGELTACRIVASSKSCATARERWSARGGWRWSTSAQSCPSHSMVSQNPPRSTPPRHLNAEAPAARFMRAAASAARRWTASPTTTSMI
jgi:hypothetical protein